MIRLAYIIATWFGCGRFPGSPGTAGSAAAVLIAVGIEQVWPIPAWGFAILAALLFAPATWAAGVAASDSKLEDPQFVVVDEVIGQWIALAGARSLDWRSCLIAFVLFRVFDIWKPWPARQLEDLPGGLGINADDVMAGIYAALVLFGARCFNLI